MRLSLIIKKEPFADILAGKKKKEYRNTTDRLAKQICNFGEADDGFCEVLSFKPVTELLLLNGYHKNRPTALVECTGIEIEADLMNDSDFFVFLLGKIISFTL